LRVVTATFTVSLGGSFGVHLVRNYGSWLDADIKTLCCSGKIEQIRDFLLSGPNHSVKIVMATTHLFDEGICVFRGLRHTGGR